MLAISDAALRSAPSCPSASPRREDHWSRCVSMTSLASGSVRWRKIARSAAEPSDIVYVAASRALAEHLADKLGLPLPPCKRSVLIRLES